MFSRDRVLDLALHLSPPNNLPSYQLLDLTSYRQQFIGEIVTHTQSVTSICAKQDGNVVLTSRMDNVHNVIDIRTMKICGKLKTKGNKVARNWTRTCVSPCGEYAAVGSVEGLVYVWSIKMGKMVGALKGHGGPVVCCSWSGSGLKYLHLVLRF